MRSNSVSCPAPSSTPKYPLQSRLVPGKKYSFHLKTCMKETDSPSHVCVCEWAGTVCNRFFQAGLRVWWGILGPIQELLGISGARRSWNLYIKALQWEWWASCTQNVHAEYQISETLPFLSYRKVKEQKRNSAFPMSHFIYREKEFKYGLGTTQSLQEHIIIGMVGMLLSWEGGSCQ